MEYAFGAIAWDYTGTFLNINGRTNFMFMCMWGVLGVVWVKLALPALLHTVNLIPWRWRNSITALCAALMIFDIAERFGLSQLHQLRGRIGRGPFQSYCVLVSDAHTDEARARLKVLCDTADGFQIAEADQRQRGPGDFFGNRQHGLPALHIADLGTNMTAVNDARDAARTVLAADPTLSAPEHAALRAQCARLFAANGGHFN